MSTVSENGNKIEYMPSLLGNADIRARLCRDVLSGKVAHAYVFEGPFGVGKYTLAIQLAAALSCLNKDGGVLPCGECEHCRKILGGLTPDVTVIECEDGKASISKEQINRLIGTVYFAPNQMDRRVIIIRRAHLMTKEAQNALLLTLEEPPEYVLFLLLTDNAGGLLETVRSRAPTLRLCGLADGELKRHLLDTSDQARMLERKDERALDELILKSQGSIGAAYALLDPTACESYRQLRRITDEAIEAFALKERGVIRLLDLFDDTVFKDRERTGEVLISIQSALRDLLVLKRADRFTRLCYYTDAERCEELGDSFTVQGIVDTISLVEEARLAVCVRNANTRLTLTRLSQDCAEAL